MGRKARLRKEKLLVEKRENIEIREKTTVDTSNKLTKSFQNNIKKSPMWKEIVKEFGKEKALELLKECKADLR